MTGSIDRGISNTATPNVLILDLKNNTLIFDDRVENLLGVNIELNNIFSRLPRKASGFLHSRENNHVAFLVNSVLFVAEVLFVHGSYTTERQAFGNRITVTISDELFRELFSELKYINIELVS